MSRGISNPQQRGQKCQYWHEEISVAGAWESQPLPLRLIGSTSQWSCETQDQYAKRKGNKKFQAHGCISQAIQQNCQPHRRGDHFQYKARTLGVSKREM